VEYFNYLGSLVTNAARCTCEIKSRIAMAKAAFNKNTFQEQLGPKFMEELVKCYFGAWVSMVLKLETLEDQKYLESFEMCCWRRMEKTSWTKHVKNDICERIKKEKNILHTIK
jgi:hypothetical protein